MSISRRFILSELYRQFEVTPKDQAFISLAKEMILDHYDRISDDLLDSSKFEAEMRVFKSKSNKYYKERKTKGSYAEFIEDPQHHLDFFDGFVFPPEIKSDFSTPSTSGQLGRPPKDFEDMGRSRRSEAIKDIADTHSEAELFEALALKLKRRGFSSAVKAVNFLAMDPEANGKKIVDSLSTAGIYTYSLAVSSTLD